MPVCLFELTGMCRDELSQSIVHILPMSCNKAVSLVRLCYQAMSSLYETMRTDQYLVIKLNALFLEALLFLCFCNLLHDTMSYLASCLTQHTESIAMHSDANKATSLGCKQLIWCSAQCMTRLSGLLSGAIGSTEQHHVLKE